MNWKRLGIQKSAGTFKSGALLYCIAVRLALPSTFYYELRNILRVCFVLDVAAGMSELLQTELGGDDLEDTGVVLGDL